MLGESKERCTCYKFQHWEGLWREDRAKATRLRKHGWHIVGVCELLDNDGPSMEKEVCKSTRLRWLELLDGCLRERGGIRHAVSALAAEGEEAFALELEQQFHEVGESCAGINTVWKKLVEADGFFSSLEVPKESFA